jgi:hypothetical protein
MGAACAGGFGGGGFGRGLAAFLRIIGYIKTGPLKDDTVSAVDHPAYFPAAPGAALQGIIGHALKHFKRMAAAFTFVFIGRHVFFPLWHCMLYRCIGQLRNPGQPVQGRLLRWF